MTCIETTDIFRGAFLLCMGGDLYDIRIPSNGSRIATFFIKGQALHKHDKDYMNGHALVNPLQFREALNHLRDVLFNQLNRTPTHETRYDRAEKNPNHQNPNRHHRSY